MAAPHGGILLESPMISSAVLANQSSSALRVLVVDDHADMLNMLHLLMQKRSYAVKTATNGFDALELALEFAPHVVVSDIGMPGMDGFQFMENLRAAPQVPPFKSIALTGYDLVTESSRASAAGYDAQLTKPVEFDELFAVIEKLAADMAGQSGAAP